MGAAKVPAMLLLLLGVALMFGAAVNSAQLAASSRRANHYDFFVMETNVTRLCHEKAVLTVNGKFPGPTIYARKGDVIFVNVYNQGNKNISIHWHGVDQPRNPWFDGPAYITQCPIQPGANFTYRVILSKEEGTLWWHAHTNDFDRATVHGAFVIYPKRGATYPYKKPHKEIPIILGEWWKQDLNNLVEVAKRTGGHMVQSDTITINGQPGDLSPCSKNGTFRVAVEHGKTYLLRIISVGLTDELFFVVAGHRLTVVGTDGGYLKPFTVETIMISPGQTMNVLLVADRATNGSGNSRFYMAARTYRMTLPTMLNTSNAATAILEYTDAPPSEGPPDFPSLPAINDRATAEAFMGQLRSLATKDNPVDVPVHVDEQMVMVVNINVLPCPPNVMCTGPENLRFAASLNNVSFMHPSIDVLDAYYYSIPGIYEEDFPSKPPFVINFTAADPPVPPFTKQGTKVKVLEYGTVVEVLFQGPVHPTSESLRTDSPSAAQNDHTQPNIRQLSQHKKQRNGGQAFPFNGIIGVETHPMHLHGHRFYVVGRGLGIFDENKDPASYNLVDPPYQNTVSVATGGWAVIRFRATNPGVWFMHCHLERHTIWGMETVFIVKDGDAPEAKMMSRPPNMPQC